MKITRSVITNLIFFIILALIFFTPAGTYVKTQISKLTLSAPQVEELKSNESFFSQDTDLEIKGFGTEDLNLNDLKGEVIFLNFWASWCPPCRAEMPSIQKLYDSKKNEVKFVLVTVQDQQEKFLPYLERNNFTMPVYEPASLMSKKLRPDAFPTTYIIDKKGNVILKETTAADWNSEEIHTLLEKLIQ